MENFWSLTKRKLNGSKVQPAFSGFVSARLLYSALLRFVFPAESFIVYCILFLCGTLFT
jgi:hypothetical protein